MTKFSKIIWYHLDGDNMQIEIISSYSEDDLVYKVNYFLDKIDECLIKDIKYSSFIMPDNKTIYHTCMIVYLIRW